MQSLPYERQSVFHLILKSGHCKNEFKATGFEVYHTFQNYNSHIIQIFKKTKAFKNKPTDNLGQVGIIVEYKYFRHLTHATPKKTQ